ncbi:hypothetical protein [Jeongeupia naejangsanensis]|uniref:DUF3025 domain-containing protein n=1 Tax=Jeongeupia naejangsanensis TaxID=613195 RepID=A0ABS2BMI7_9NEIS|nr:hypothetical protein [Jeongeupia naejangsanensis]MBM3116831.1 hypothetical protein [Jeongeupia naejangsanensis]
MSPLSIDHHGWLLRSQVLLASRPRWPRGPVVRRAELIDGTADTAVLRLQQLLADAPSGRFDTLTLHLGAPWVRYSVLPWQDNLKRDADWQGYARVLMASQFNVATDTWRVAIEDGSYGAPRLAAAVDQGLYQTLIELARTRRCKLQAVAPLLTDVTNRYRSDFKSREFALILAEHEHVTCLFRKQRSWRGVVTLPAPAGGLSGASLASLVRDAAMLASDFVPHDLYLASTQAPVEHHDESFDVEWLGGLHPLLDAAREWARPEVSA